MERSHIKGSPLTRVIHLQKNNTRVHADLRSSFRGLFLPRSL